MSVIIAELNNFAYCIGGNNDIPMSVHHTFWVSCSSTSVAECVDSVKCWWCQG